MKISKSFAPLYRESAKVLVLGSMPGLASLKAQEYYAHPRNCFWRIIAELCGASPPIEYADKLALIYRHKIAVWDVLKYCEREGSLDSNIVRSSEVANDFGSLLKAMPELGKIVFNGKKAEQSFAKHVAPNLRDELCGIETLSLPSTSPANAAMSYEQKLGLWKAALDLKV